MYYAGVIIGVGEGDAYPHYLFAAAGTFLHPLPTRSPSSLTTN